MKEYIVSGDVLAGIEDSVSSGELVRCNDCIKCQAVNRRNLPPGMYCPIICADVDPLFYCALGTQRGGDGK